MKEDLLIDFDNVDILEDEYVKMLFKGALYGASQKMIQIFMYCGYDIERYINNYYRSLDPLNYRWAHSQLFRIIDDNNNIISDNKLTIMKNKNEEEFIKIMKFFESHGLILDRFNDKPNSYSEFIAFHFNDENIINNGAVKTLLMSAIRMHHVDMLYINPEKYENSDYTYLMVNYVKSLERFMFYKLNKIEPFSDYDKEHDTFYSLEVKINKYITENVKDIPEGLLKEYTNLLSKFREVYRNGYFHRDIISREKAYMTNELVLILIIMTELIINV